MAKNNFLFSKLTIFLLDHDVVRLNDLNKKKKNLIEKIF
jgi:hypothetical protein